MTGSAYHHASVLRFGRGRELEAGTPLHSKLEGRLAAPLKYVSTQSLRGNENNSPLRDHLELLRLHSLPSVVP